MSCILNKNDVLKRFRSELTLVLRRNSGLNTSDQIKLAIDRTKEKLLNNNDYDLSEVSLWISEVTKEPKFSSLKFPEDLVSNLIYADRKEIKPSIAQSNIGETTFLNIPLKDKNFIDEFYGESQARLLMLKGFNINMIKNMLIDIDLETVTKNQSDMNNKILSYQEELYKSIVEYLIENGSTKTYSETLFKEGETYSSAFGEILEEMDKLLELQDLTALSKMFISSSEKNKKKLNAINNYFILKNFDKLIQHEYGKFITISDKHYRKITNETAKYAISKENDSKNATSWFDKEVMSVTDVLDNHVRLLIESIPYYVNGKLSNNYLNTDHLTFISRYIKLRLRTNVGKQFSLINDYGNIRLFHRKANPFTLSPLELQFILDYNIRTLYDVSVNLRNNPIIGYRLLFKILASDEFYENRKIKNGLYRQGLYIIDSIFRGIFDDTHSIYAVSKENDANFYEELIHFMDFTSSLSLTQYVFSDEGLKIKTMSAMNIDNAEWDLRETINSQLSNVKRFKDEYRPELNQETKSVRFGFGDYSILYNYNTKKYQIYKINPNKTETLVHNFNKLTLEDFSKFIYDVIGIDVNTNLSLLDTMLNGNEANYPVTFTNLAGIAIPSFSNAILLRSDLTLSRLDKQSLGEDYGISFDKDYGDLKYSLIYLDIDVIPRSIRDKIQNVANSISVVNGLLTRSVMRTGEKTNISANTISNLMSERKNQFAVQNSKIDSATKGLMDEVEDWALSREFIGAGRALQHILFNNVENIYSSFIFDFLSPDEEIRFTEAVNSDKPNVPKIIVKRAILDNILKHKGIQGLYDKIEKDLSPVYNIIWNNINSDFNKLNSFCSQSELYKDVLFDCNTNFSQFNEQATLMSRKPSELFSEIVRHYNLENRKQPLTFSDNVHVRFNGNDLEMNLGFITTLLRFNKADILPYFRNLYETKFGTAWTSLQNLLNFLRSQTLKFIDDCLNENFSIDLYRNGEKINEAWVGKLTNVKGWEYRNKVTLAKVKIGNRWRNVVSKADLHGIVDRNGNTCYDSDFDFSNIDYEVLVHPLLEQYNLALYLWTQKSVLSTNGSHLWSDAKKLKGTILEEEGSWNDFNKRNVENTATAKLFTLNSLKGITEYINIAVIKDIKELTLAAHGETGSVKPFDGSTFVDPFGVYWENESLGNSITGVTKKPIVHFYDERTASGGLIKTATFGISNEKLRNSMFFRRMMYKMTHHQWSDESGNIIDHDITTDYRGNKINFSDLYYRKNGKYYQISDLVYKGNNTYDLLYTEVDSLGNVSSRVKSKEYIIDNNYTLWKVLGGYESVLLDANSKFIDSENSIKRVSEIASRTGIKKHDGLIETLADIYQFMKHSDIHYVVTEGAIKKGAANVNDKSLYYNNEDYNFYRIRMANAGIQLDPTHLADNAEVSLMTLVISALADRGYTSNAAQAVYTALGRIAKNAIAEDFDAYRTFLRTGSKHEILQIVVKSIIDAFKKTKSNDGNLAQAISLKLYNMVQNNLKITSEDLTDVIPWSDNSMFRFISSTVSSTINKMAIKTKAFGSLSVLNPSHDIYLVFGNKKLSEFSSLHDISTYNLELESKLINKHQIEIGRNYAYQIELNGQVIEIRKKIGKLSEYYELINNPTVSNVRETLFVDSNSKNGYLLKVSQEGNPELSYYDVDSQIELNPGDRVLELSGRNLGSYNIHLNNGEFSIYDLDSVRNRYLLQEAKAEELELKKKTLRTSELESRLILLLALTQNYELRMRSYLKQLLKDLLSITEKQSVMINGVLTKIDNYETTAYEILMPMIYQSKFGLLSSDNLSEISSDKYFFLKRFLLNYKRTASFQNYDIELKLLNGDNVYLASNVPENLIEVNVDTSVDSKGRVWRLDSKGNRLYQMSSKQDRVFVDLLGGEIIYTSNPNHYIDKVNYFDLRVSGKANKVKVLEVLNNSEKTKELDAIKIRNINNSLITSFIKSGDLSVLLKDKNITKLIDRSLEVHTSFLKSLEVLAARIPAQSMLSFMGMKVAGFVNTGINDCYVSDMLIWLLGSDFDIDKVTLMGHAFNNDGRYIKWSPYINLRDSHALNITSDLSYPTGKEVLTINDDTDLSKYQVLFEKNWKLNIRPSDPDFYLKLELLTDMINQHSEILPGKESALKNAIKNVINKHNLYEPYDNEAALMNFVASNATKISLNPVNMIASQSAIDNATEPLKQEANKSAFGKKDKRNNPANGAVYAKAMFTNLTGKMGIAITASVGVKSYFALSQYFNLKIKNGEVNDLLFETRILMADPLNGGKVYKVLLNTLAENIERLRQIKPKLAEAIENQEDFDADMVISGILSLATDNAKELALAKLNAGLDMLGLYIYGATIGVPFNILTKILTSDVAVILSKYMKGNRLTGKPKMSLESAISKFKRGPQHAITNAGTPAGEFIGEYNSFREKVIDYISKGKINELWNDYYTLYNKYLNPKYMDFLNELSEFIYDIATVKNFDVLKDIETLFYGQLELATLRSLLGLNLGIKVLMDDKLNFYDMFENIIADRVKNIEVLTEALRNSLDMLRAINGDDSLKINFIRYMTDSKYHNDVINIYEQIKMSYNILDVVDKVPHFKAYLDSSFADYIRLSNSSVFRALNRLLPEVKSAYRPYGDLRKIYYTKLNTFLTSILNNKWLYQQQIFTIPKNNYIVDRFGEILESKDVLYILLGTDTGNATFKLWMENEVIPNLKKGLLFADGVEQKKYLNMTGKFANEFVRDLRLLYYNKTTSRNNISAYTLPIDMIPKSEFEKLALVRYKTALSDLSKYAYSVDNDTKYNLVDLFFLYNLITYLNKSDKHALTPVLETLYRIGNNETVNSYIKFISNFDANSELLLDRDFTRDEMLLAVAPFTNEIVPERFGGLFINVFNNQTEKYEIFERKRKSDNTETFDEGFAPEDSIANEAYYDSENDLEFYAKVGNKEYIPITNGGFRNLISTFSVLEKEPILFGIGVTDKPIEYGFNISTDNSGNITKVRYTTDQGILELDPPEQVRYRKRLVDNKLVDALDELDLTIKLLKLLRDKLNICG